MNQSPGMASIHRKPGSRFWYAFYADRKGGRRNFSTGMEDESEALAVAVAVERVALENVSG